MKSKDILVMLFTLVFVGMLMALVPKSSNECYGSSRGGEKLVPLDSVGAAAIGCKDLYFYGAITKPFKSGSSSVTINDGQPIHAYTVSDKSMYYYVPTEGFGWTAMWKNLSLKAGDKVCVSTRIDAKDGTSQSIQNCFNVGTEVCSKSSLKNSSNATALFGHPPVNPKY